MVALREVYLRLRAVLDECAFAAKSVGDKAEREMAISSAFSEDPDSEEGGECASEYWAGRRDAAREIEYEIRKRKP